MCFILRSLYLFVIGDERAFCEETERSAPFAAETLGETVIIGGVSFTELIYKHQDQPEFPFLT